MRRPACILFAAAAALLAAARAASVVPCPESCACTLTGEDLHARCHSLDFVRKLRPKQTARIASLDLSAASLTSIDPKIKLLKNLINLDVSANELRDLAPLAALARLENLDASANRLAAIAGEALPKNLKNLNLSANNITQLPGALPAALANLQSIDLTGNPIACDCNAAAFRGRLLGAGVGIVEPVKCGRPEKMAGRSWASGTTCGGDAGVWDQMQGDEPVEGSGSGDEDVNGADVPMEPEYIPEAATPSRASESALDEGSGDDDVGDYDEEVTTEAAPPPPPLVDETQIEKEVDYEGDKPKPCHINCSTPAPVGEHDEAGDSEPPTFFEGMKIVYDDLSGGSGEAAAEDVRGEVYVKEGRKIDAVEAVEVAADAGADEAPAGKDLGPLAAEPRKNAHTTYIVLSVLLIVMIFVIVYAIVKSRNKRARNRRRRLQNGAKDPKGTEMKLITAPPSNREKPNNGAAPERVPLMNGQNGKAPADAQETGDDYVELRQRNNSPATPEARRVTIRASELPDSVPKTPLLVNRHVSSDGEIITTPSDRRAT